MYTNTSLIKGKGITKGAGILLSDMSIQFSIDTLQQLEILENYLKEKNKFKALVNINYLLINYFI